MKEKREIQIVSLDEVQAIGGGWLLSTKIGVASYDWDYDYTYAGFQSHNTGGDTVFFGNGNTVIGNGSNNSNFSLGKS